MIKKKASRFLVQKKTNSPVSPNSVNDGENAVAQQFFLQKPSKLMLIREEDAFNTKTNGF